MRALIGCECSGIIREAFRKRGHDAWSCDIKPSEDKSPFHIQCDCLWFVENIEPFDLFIVHPPCTYLCGSGLHWTGSWKGPNKLRPERLAQTEAAIEFASRCWAVPDIRVCMENPVGVLSRALRRPTQIIQPYNFGEDASKKTCLWLHQLPPLRQTKYVEPRVVNGKKRWANQTDSGQNKLAPSPTRAADRARTYQGIADAMAEQWGIL